MKILIVVLLLIVSLGCVGQKPAYTGEEIPPEESYTGGESPNPSCTEEESLEIAQKYVLNSPTYKYDGENLEHTETLKGTCSNCWIFIFEFTSRKAGYGNRSKQDVLQVITQHTATVTVENGQVVSANLDDAWNMINQKMIDEPEESSTEEEKSQSSCTEEESLAIARDFVLNSPTYKYDGENLEHTETLKATCSNCWIFIFEFTSRKAGYGNRSKQDVLQVITQHTATVTVENGQVVSANLDDAWNMISQEMIE